MVDDYDQPIEKKNNESLKYFEDLINKRNSCLSLATSTSIKHYATSD